jgi:hypothetical protein
LHAVLVDDLVSPQEADALSEMRKKYNLSDADHLRALKEAGSSERDFLLACMKGLETKTVHRFGLGNSKIVIGDVDNDKVY